MFEKIQKYLTSSASEKVALSGQRFFKEEILIHGVSTPEVHKFSRDIFREMKEKSKVSKNISLKSEVFDLCEKLWKTGFYEECIIACDLSDFVAKDFEETDFFVFEKWIQKYVKNWATCDTFCNHTVGDFLMKYPKFVSEMKRFALSKNLWERRAAAVSLILPVRRGLFLKESFEISDILLRDTEDLVQKGYGWLLKVSSGPYLEEVFEFVMKRKSLMPRTALRYAIEKMPKEYKAKAMKL
jgi:3-methyladenine DNA glycosylase AlkD